MRYSLLHIATISVASCYYSLPTHHYPLRPHSAAFVSPRRYIRPPLQFCNLPRSYLEIGPATQRRHDDMIHHMSTLQDATEITSQTMSAEVDDDDNNISPAESYFDEQQFAAYENAIEEIISKPGVKRDFKKKEEDLIVVKAHLLDKKRKLPQWDVHQYIPTKDATEPNKYTKQKLQERYQVYLNHTNLTAQQHKLSQILLAHLADHCAKNSTPQPLYVAWEKILEAGMAVLSRSLSTYLYVLSLDENNERSSNERDIAAEVAMFHDALYEPTEKTITLLVKSLVSKGDAEGAEELLDSLSDGPLGRLRHRTTSPILKLYCENGDIDSALRLYHRMRTTSRVKMDGATYSDFIAAVAQNGCFSNNSNCIVGAEDLGYSQSCGPALLNDLLHEMSEDVLDISEESTKILRNGFVSGFSKGVVDIISDSDDIENMTSLCDNNMLVANRVTVNKQTAKCPATGTTLRLIVLEQSQRIHVHDTLLDMAREKSMEYTAKLAAKGRSTKDNTEKAEMASQILTEFSQWLDTREGKPYTAIVDGANVAYFGWGRINVHQLMYMVNALENQGEYPLVVFPKKYTWRKFHLRHGMMQVLTDDEFEFLENLQKRDQMYVVPPMCLDDLCK